MHKYTLNLNIVPYNPTNCSIFGRFVILDQTQVKILACAPPSSLPEDHCLCAFTEMHGSLHAR